MILRLALLALAWTALTAAAPLPLTPPPPDLAPLVPWAEVPLDKPPVTVPRLALPPPPLGLPLVAPAPIVPPQARKPMAPVPAPRALPCVVGGWLQVSAGESLECGLARIAHGEWDEATRALEQAVRSGADRGVLAEAHYWLAEAHYRRGRIEQADWMFRQVPMDLAVPNYRPWALNGAGWTALWLGDAPRAEDTFRKLLSAPQPVPLDSWGRHGLALALYARGRYEEAEKVWADLRARRVPVDLARDVIFWHGDTLARLGQVERGIGLLVAFTQGGEHPLLAAGLLRLGWWRLAAAHAADALAALRTLATLPPAETAREREWLDAGLALALIDTGDWTGARAAIRSLDSRRSALAQPLRLRFAAAALVAGRVAETKSVVQELLVANLTVPVRAWVLLVKGEARRVEGNRDEARTQFDLARGPGLSTEIGRQATLRLAETNFELREFAQAAADLVPLLNTATTPEMRLTALLLRGEASYRAGDYAAAAEAYGRVLVEAPQRPQNGEVRLALAWTAMRRGTRGDALKQFLAFARSAPSDPHTIDALVLASELTLAEGRFDAARNLLADIIVRYGTHPRVELARLNRALLRLRMGESQEAARDLIAWIAREPSSPLVGRAAVALGAALVALGRPADAARQFARAQAEGVTGLAHLGLGAVAIAEGRWDEAARQLTKARDIGTAAIAAGADYGLAVVASYKGKVAAFAPAARVALQAAPHGVSAPRILYVLTGLAAADKNWKEAVRLARRLVDEFPRDERADDALERVGSGAAAAGAWPVAYEMYSLLRQRYLQSPFVAQSAVVYARVLLETRRPGEARALLETVVRTPGDPRAGRAWLLLARARDAVGDRAGALDAYGRAANAGDSVTWTTDVLFAYARALTGARRFGEARAVLQRVLRGAEGPAVGDAALALGEAYEEQGDVHAAVDYYLTAAYAVPGSPAGRRALLAAGHVFAAARDADSAAIVYRKLLAQPNLPANLATQARKALAEVER